MALNHRNTPVVPADLSGFMLRKRKEEMVAKA
jgi:hypothetical protein